MLLGIMSDIHDDFKNLLRAIKIFNDRKTEYVIHCGDWNSPSMPDFCANLNCKVFSVFGNNEGDVPRFYERREKNGWNVELFGKCMEKTFDNKKIIVYHGESEPLLNGLIESQKYDVVFSGHTHKEKNEMVGKTLHVNPGTVSDFFDPKIVDRASIAIYDTKKNKAEIIPLKN